MASSTLNAMERSLPKLLLVGVFTLLSVSAIAVQLPKALAARYAWEKKTVETRDLAAFLRLFSKDFINVSPEGKKSSLDQFAKDIALIFKAEEIKMKETFSKVVKTATGYVVSYNVELRIAYKDGNNEIYQEVGVDTWSRVKDKWLLVKSVSKKVTITPLK